ncbi:MAG TPA: ATP-binding protein [Pyrinomonadaceae bacterium]|nr:ATP-binding protein [Pyrinomonadaceae bacterium]
MPSRTGLPSSLLLSNFWLIAAIVFAASFAFALAVDLFGIRRSLLYTGAAMPALALISFAVWWFFARDILFTPTLVALGFTAVAAQVKRLYLHDNQLTRKLFASSMQRSEAALADDRLASGLKLLDIVLSPSEAVVFRKGIEGELVSAARLRAAGASANDTARNSLWREGIKVCERAMNAREVVVEKVASDETTTIIALPLRHEERTVGALLLRTSQEFEDADRALLMAVGSQMARNLQRDQVGKANRERGPLDFFSATAARKRLDSLYVLNGALVEQRVGLGALTEIQDAVSLAYLDGRIAYANDAMRALASLDQTDISHVSVFDLLDQFRTDVFDEPVIAVRRVLQTGQAYERELHNTERNETLGLRISLVFDDAVDGENTRQPLCLAVIVKDLTRIKEYEQLKSDMISLMSHELRTPLTSINGFAELLAMDDELPEQAKEFVTIIANESQRLSRMINTFLAVTKLERKDKQEVLKIPLRLDEVVKETITSLQPVARKRRIRLVEQPTQRLPPVAADKSMITQAVKNLVNNAIKYSPERTTVVVSTALEAEAVRLSVEDRGYGIPTEARDRVWEKFYRVVREGQEKDEESTGLGLSFVREVVEQHGGTVGLESEVGRGSKFSFTLPRL